MTGRARLNPVGAKAGGVLNATRELLILSGILLDTQARPIHLDHSGVFVVLSAA